MENLTSFIGILGVLCLGIMSPGPSFVLVARTSVAISRADGLATAFGMGIGGMIFAILALLGLQAVLLSVPVLYIVLKLFGGVYLLYLAFMIWRGSTETIDLNTSSSEDSRKYYQSAKIGLFTQLSNPKTAIYYTSVFAALLPPNLSISVMAILAITIFFLEAGWYCVVALVLSSQTPRKIYLSLKTVLDRLASLIIGGLGLKLIFEAKSI